MNAAAQLPLPAARKNRSAAPFDIAPVTRILIALAAAAMSLACLIALTRWMAGFAPDHAHARSIAVIIHVATVLPCIPLGGWLFLTRKGGKTHKRLGKIWVSLMVTAATSAIFIRTGGSFSFIHIFVPVTLIGAWRTIASARAGRMEMHKRVLLGMYFGALMIPGIFAFALPGRMMATWLMG